MAPKRKLAVGAVLTEVLQTYRTHAGPLLSLAAIVFLPLTLLTEIIGRESVGAGMGVSLALSGSAAFLYCAVTAPLALNPRPNAGEVSIGELWSAASPNFAALVLAGAVYTAATTLGVLLLIVPGLILITIWAVAAPIIRFENAGALAALSRSQGLVKGHGWQTFAVVICVVLIVLGGSILVQSLAIGITGEETGTFIGSWLSVVLAAPMFALMSAILYRTLNDEKPSADEVDPPESV